MYIVYRYGYRYRYTYIGSPRIMCEVAQYPCCVCVCVGVEVYELQHIFAVRAYNHTTHIHKHTPSFSLHGICTHIHVYMYMNMSTYMCM